MQKNIRAKTMVKINVKKSIEVLAAKNGKRMIDLANHLGVAKSYVSTIKRENSISNDYLIKTCEFFGVSVSEFYKAGEE